MRFVLSARALPTVAVAALLLASACGGDGSSPSPSPPPSPAGALPSPAPEPTPTPTPEPTPTPQPQARIAFGSTRDGNNEIYIMNADGSGLTRLTNSPEHESEPAWQPQP